MQENKLAIERLAAELVSRFSIDASEVRVVAYPPESSEEEALKEKQR